MAAIKETAERLWSGQLSTRDQHPFTATGEIEEIAPKVAFCRWLGNFTVCKTDEGLVLIDTGSYFNQDQTLALIRTYSTARIHTVIYTHGHLDHAGGTAAIVAEAGKNRVARPRVVGHRAIAERLDRYKRAAGYNQRVDDLLYGSGAAWPAEFVYPDTYFDHQLNVVAGADKFQCHHARGETRGPLLGLHSRRQGSMHRRFLHLGRSECGPSAQGAALSARLGRGVARDGEERRRGAAARPWQSDFRRDAHPSGA